MRLGFLTLAVGLLLAGCRSNDSSTRRSPETSEAAVAPARTRLADSGFQVSELLFSDDFTNGLGRWSAELEMGGTVEARGGVLSIDVPGGCTVWFKPVLEGPVLIEYEAIVIQAGGPNDRSSDLNCFWMARDARSPNDLFASTRSGRFADYDQLLCYYVGLGGNNNSTTRFRRYIGKAGDRPILPEHDLSAGEFLIVPNRTQRIQLVACGPDIAYYRDGRRLFGMKDSEPYRSGWFGLRTVRNHMEIRRFRVFRLRCDAP